MKVLQPLGLGLLLALLALVAVAVTLDMVAQFQAEDEDPRIQAVQRQNHERWLAATATEAARQEVRP